MAKSKEYWKKRLESIADTQNKKVDTYIESLELQYKKALLSIQKDLESFYIRYGNAEGVDMFTARKLLSNAEKEMWEVSLEEYRKMALDEEFIDQMESMYSKSRVSRLKALEMQIRAKIEVLYTELNSELEALLENTFTDTYYQTIYEIQLGTGIGTNFAIFNEDAVEKIVSKPWKWGHFSSTVWDNKALLLDELETALSQAFIRGDSIDKVIKTFDKRMGVGYSRAANIIQTEHAYIAGEATFKGYEETGIEEYEYLATLDTRTSQVCRDMDGKIFKLSEKVVWLNYPPLHCRCRSTTIPYFKDEESYSKRIARDHEGKVYYVPEDMKYHDWYNKYVKSNPDELLAEKKHKNKHADKKQHARYRKVLGKRVPRSLDEFQNLKYTDDNRWLEVKSLYRSVNWQVKCQSNITIGNEVHKVPITGVADSIFDNYKNGKLESRRYFGATGKVRLDIDLTNHGNAKEHPIVPHAHDWNFKDTQYKDVDPNLQGRLKVGRELSRAELIANKDILKGVKNNG